MSIGIRKYPFCKGQNVTRENNILCFFFSIGLQKPIKLEGRGCKPGVKKILPDEGGVEIFFTPGLKVKDRKLTFVFVSLLKSGN